MALRTIDDVVLGDPLCDDCAVAFAAGVGDGAVLALSPRPCEVCCRLTRKRLVRMPQRTQPQPQSQAVSLALLAVAAASAGVIAGGCIAMAWMCAGIPPFG